MVIDIIIAVIFILSVVLGVRRGLVYTVAHVAGWFVALVAAFFGTTPAIKLIQSKTQIYDNYTAFFADKLGANSAVVAPDGTVSGAISSFISEIGVAIKSDIATAFSEMSFKIIVFFLIFILVKIIIWIILHGFSKEYNKNTGNVDGFLGGVFGALRGMVLVYLFLMIMLPVVGFVAPNSLDNVTAALDSSYVAKTLYDNNIVLMFIQKWVG